MNARETIQALIDLKRDEPYGNEPSYQLGYLMEIVSWLANMNADVLDDLKLLLNYQNLKEKGKDQ
jgi:hypothetical protein